MDFIVGGTANGKKEWAMRHYQEKPILLWHSFFKADISECVLPTGQNGVLVIEAFDEAVKKHLDQPEKLQQWYKTIRNWENEYQDRKLAIIGADINKGIVPIEKKDRQLRDEVGLWYQQFMKEAGQVYEVWYGLAVKWKG
ncbi:adenosylcobinamide kinase /adenosylcobinamide-phosphate guanylyltransferase [Sinobaca qinghaiensis]|uniref:Adenosylcobinamide kinase /adenosylcobinamide-phosphate guanylyltransferase n=1 Tax=Sinobaca qinghaiensis TaxID=342944 RepID=A0A419V2Z2_9BACL|nr:bifunctional adenosylcobinamide kinase/adenosylcobinamide-phosphate guanylyltransferase [Sinobaca qinghaiensis]RKD72889.1 adenosylcobinamide kinase /adenosylcobinamide-phosphate guanylyltransferase [Sinobaca qinghaiensis]